MNLTLSPEMLAAGYDFLRTTKPFSRWRLPPASEIKFHVAKSPLWYGRMYQFRDGDYGIEVSSRMVSMTSTLLAVLGHETVHLRQALAAGGHALRATHNAEFRRLAALACRIHGWDLRAFWC